jgi:2-polyprenyl-6-methoxyphenol hydroxylase-like FAD-dependent oxidoreductase
MTDKPLDVLVIGAGPVGLFCANELTRHGLRCRIIEKKTNLSEHSKALGIHIRTMDVMADCDFLDEMFAQGLKINQVCFKSKGKELVRASFEGVKAKWRFILDLPQNETEAILYKGLAEKGIPVEWQTELIDLRQDKESVHATLKAGERVEEIKASWLIACDGAHSTVRHLSQLDFVGAPYKQQWWLADLTIDWHLPPDSMYAYLHADGPLACFPITASRYRLVMTTPLNQDKTPTIEDITAVFNQRSSDKAQLSNPIWLTKFNLHHRQIQQYRRNRIFLAGDAAHIHSPIGGQGLNTGLQDIYNLVWKLALVEKGLAKETILDSYHAERYAVGASVLKKTDVMTRMILLKNPFLIFLRNMFMSFIMSFAAIRKKLATNIAGLDISYAGSPIVVQSGSNFKAGYFLTDFHLRDVHHQKRMLSQITKGTAHHLFLFEGLESSNIQPLIVIAQYIQKHYKKVIIPHLVLRSEIKVESTLSMWFDENNIIHQQYHIKKATLLFIRPDKYIGFVQSPADLEKLKGYLQNIYQGLLTHTNIT